MNIHPLARQLLINGLMARSAVRGVRRGSAWVGYVLIAGGIAMIAIVFLAIAGYGLLLQSFAQPAAAALTGLGLALVALGMGGVGYLCFTGKIGRPAPKKPEGLIENIEEKLQEVLSNLDEPIRDNPKTAMLLAAMAGFAAGDKIN